jgi:hypothetical protein
VGLREFGDGKADAILKYYEEEARELQELGEIPEHIKINEGGDIEYEGEGMEMGGEEEKEEELDIDVVSILFLFFSRPFSFYYHTIIIHGLIISKFRIDLRRIVSICPRKEDATATNTNNDIMKFILMCLHLFIFLPFLLQ